MARDEMVEATQKWLKKTYTGVPGFSNFGEGEIDGITGQATFRRLIQALQIELNKDPQVNIVVDGDFGNATLNALPATIGASYPNENMVKIIQGSFWCKGYNPGPLDGIYGDAVSGAVRQFEQDAGLAETGVIKPVTLQGIMNTDAYAFSGESGSLMYYQHLVQLEMNRRYGTLFGIVAPNGIWERKSHKMLIKCCQSEWGIANPDGIWGNNTRSKAPTLRMGSANSESIRLLTWALAINGYYEESFTNAFTTTVHAAVMDFQSFMCIGADGIAGKGTWASLLSSKGDTNRSFKAFDTASVLTASSAAYFRSRGYTDVGRYLTNAHVPNAMNKRLTIPELQAISQAGLRVFPIFQTQGNSEAYFTREWQAEADAFAARTAAQDLRFPPGTTIYFAVDFDVKTAFIEEHIVPYFRTIKSIIGGKYPVGVYGPRAVCNTLARKGLTTSSFVADMSSGFTGNIGQPMPSNWAYEQITEVSQNGIGIDQCVVSPRATGIEWRDEPIEVNESNFELTIKQISMLTAAFEGMQDNNPYKTLAGNHDGQGISLGAFQWTMASGNLPKMLQLMKVESPDEMKSALGEEKFDALDSLFVLTTESGYVQWTKDNMLEIDEEHIKADWVEALYALCDTQHFCQIQDRYMLAWGYQAARRCNIPEISFRTVRGLTLMLDTAVLVGPKIDGPLLSQYTDAIGDQVLSEQERLAIFNHHIKAYRPGNDHVASRCDCIVNGHGEVHGRQYSTAHLTDEYGVTDNIIESFPSDEAAHARMIELIGRTVV